MRLSLTTLQILRALLASAASLSGADLTRETSIRSGTVYPTLARLEAAGWIVGQWERGSAQELGRPLRRLYRLTAMGKREAQGVLDALR